jgi:hypothetical protein
VLTPILLLHTPALQEKAERQSSIGEDKLSAASVAAFAEEAQKGLHQGDIRTGYGVRVSTEICTSRMPLVPMLAHLKLLRACV